MQRILVGWRKNLEELCLAASTITQQWSVLGYTMTAAGTESPEVLRFDRFRICWFSEMNVRCGVCVSVHVVDALDYWMGPVECAEMAEAAAGTHARFQSFLFC